MPAMDLISVDLPAPLSPTSAMTSPLRTSKSTSVSACTEPNDFDTFRSSSVRGDSGCIGRVSYQIEAVEAPVGASTTLRCVLLAELLVLTDAHLGLLECAAGEEL